MKKGPGDRGGGENPSAGLKVRQNMSQEERPSSLSRSVSSYPSNSRLAPSLVILLGSNLDNLDMATIDSARSQESVQSKLWINFVVGAVHLHAPKQIVEAFSFRPAPPPRTASSQQTTAVDHQFEGWSRCGGRQVPEFGGVRRPFFKATPTTHTPQEPTGQTNNSGQGCVPPTSTHMATDDR